MLGWAPGWPVPGWVPGARWVGEGWAPSVSLPKVVAPLAEWQGDVLGTGENLGIGKGGVRSQVSGETENEWSDCLLGYGQSQDWGPSAPLSFRVSQLRLRKIRF